MGVFRQLHLVVVGRVVFTSIILLFYLCCIFSLDDFAAFLGTLMLTYSYLAFLVYLVFMLEFITCVFNISQSTFGYIIHFMYSVKAL